MSVVTQFVLSVDERVLGDASYATSLLPRTVIQNS